MGRLWLASVLGLLPLFFWNPPVDAGQGDRKYALLVGCTDYQSSGIPALSGPAHDVGLWVDLLETHGFARSDITKLAGWPDEPKARPTYSNIAAGWEDLVAKSDGDTQIFIFMAGHGTQTPIPDSQTDPLDPKNPEPDGLDEVFLPADVETATAGRPLKNHILDDQFGLWLDQFRAKGAAVWVVFDCCHSGTMDRGLEEVEHSREVPAQQLGISDQAIASAQERARKAVEAQKNSGESARGVGTLEPSALALSPSGKARGSLVVFYGAQSFETAPELPRPRTAPHTKEHYFGLLSYTLAEILERCGSAMSYRQLNQVLVGEYAAERGSSGPVPYCEGDLDREVFGLRTWPKGGDIVLKHREDTLQLNAGELRGLTLKSILSVHPAAGTKRDPKEILGYVQVTALTPATAEVVSCTDPAGKLPAVKAEQLDDLSRCQLLVRDFGDMKLQIAIRAAHSTDAELAGKVQAALGKMSEEVQALVELIPDEAAARYVLWVDGGKVSLKTGTGHKTDPNEVAAENQRSLGKSLPPRYYGDYPTDDLRLLSLRLEGDLQSVFTWQNLWRIGGTVGNKTGAENDYDLRLEFQKLNADKVADGELVNGRPVAAGQNVQYRLKNEGPADLWVILVWLDGDFGIKTKTISLRANSESKWSKGTIKGDTTGKEGLIAMAFPMREYRDQPDFEFLNQPRLKAQLMGRSGEQKRWANHRTSDTPFQKLLKAAASGKGTRSFEEAAPTNPAILTWSWIALPPAK